MTDNDRRRPTLFDVMTLIAATAIGLAISQLGWPRGMLPGAPPVTGTVTSNGVTVSFTTATPPASSGYPSRRWAAPVAQWTAPGFPVLAAWTGAYLASRLRAPRPRRRRLIRQPGLAAAVAALAVLIVEAPAVVGIAWLDGRFGWATPSRVAQVAANATVLLAHHAGLAVAVAWLTLALAGRWRAERGWIDRWGRALGCAWIAAGLLSAVLVDHVAWWGNFFEP